MDFGSLIDSALIESVVRALIPILLAALGGLICERAGIFNIALEGLLLVGAFGAVAGSYFSGSALVGVLVAVLASMAFSLMLSFGPVTRRAERIGRGVAMSIVAVGTTRCLPVAVLTAQGGLSDPGSIGMQKIGRPRLVESPSLGRALFNLTPPGYRALLLVPL